MQIGIAINLPKLDAPVYRIFRLPHFWDAFRTNELVLVAPHKWDDPFENLLTWCMLEFEDDPGRPHVSFARLRKPLYAQCWSQVEESDTLWRAYSRFEKDDSTGRNRYPAEEGVQVRSTPRKLLSALGSCVSTDPGESCFIGGVTYLKSSEVRQYVANEIGRGRLHAFPGGRGHAESILFKRSAYSHEAEVRLIYVDVREDQRTSDVIRVPFQPARVFDEISFDPRLITFERLEREAQAKSLGYTGPISKSDLYEREIFTIPVRRKE